MTTTEKFIIGAEVCLFMVGVLISMLTPYVPFFTGFLVHSLLNLNKGYSLSLLSGVTLFVLLIGHFLYRKYAHTTHIVSRVSLVQEVVFLNASGLAQDSYEIDNKGEDTLSVRLKGEENRALPRSEQSLELPRISSQGELRSVLENSSSIQMNVLSYPETSSSSPETKQALVTEPASKINLSVEGILLAPVPTSGPSFELKEEKRVENSNEPPRKTESIPVAGPIACQVMGIDGILGIIAVFHCDFSVYLRLNISIHDSLKQNKEFKELYNKEQEKYLEKFRKDDPDMLETNQKEIESRYKADKYIVNHFLKKKSYLTVELLVVEVEEKVKKFELERRLEPSAYAAVLHEELHQELRKFCKRRKRSQKALLLDTNSTRPSFSIPSNHSLENSPDHFFKKKNPFSKETALPNSKLKLSSPQRH